jgi:hypothetical protein
MPSYDVGARRATLKRGPDGRKPIGAWRAPFQRDPHGRKSYPLVIR